MLSGMQARRAEARRRARAALPAVLPYPPELPITARRQDLLDALAGPHQVLVVAGETGSGKSTQLPKLCLDAGRGSAGMIGHTQPRRIAARSIAERVSEELGSRLGGPVGYKVRFTDRVGDGTLVKLMTDGVLLAELHNDPRLLAYDTLIVDEAHERSLNIDFILGYLKRLLPARPDLKLVVTSATIDTARFSAHFDQAPVIEVSGRSYPVEVRYRPYGEPEPDDDEEEGPPPPASGPVGRGATGVADGAGTAPGDEAVDEVQAVCDAVVELCAEGPGDILVFLAGEREIRDTAEALSKLGLAGLDVLPLYGRLSSAEQHRVFEPHPGRRVVLATNVAETSLTVPGTRYVVDPGTARISRYSRRTKVQRLPIEPISQASANQRAGRCGRLGPGVCVRLYSEASFDARRPFTEPEILRTNLASVVLQMAAIGLGPAEDFPFLDPPDRRNIADGVGLLEELAALARSEEGHRLTGLGRRLAKLPLDPRLGRMVLEADRLGCLDEVLVIAAALSVQDPRERPADKREAAAALHGRFDVEGSDFLAYLALWDYLDERQEELSSGQFRRLCRREMISYQRTREWQDVTGQLTEVCRQLGSATGTRRRGPLSEQQRALVHQALLAGIATQVGLREGERTDFLAPRGARFAVWPGSVVAKHPPRWVMVAELVETGRLWGRTVAPVQPRWVERAAAHLLAWSYGEPAWDAGRAEAFVLARATLYGLVVVPGRRSALARYDREQARELFLRRALVEGEWDDAPAFVELNRATLSHLRALVQRARRTELMVGDEQLYDFYDARLGDEVTSAATFNAWWRRLAPGARAALQAREADLAASAGALGTDQFPDHWEVGGLSLPLSYNWDPGAEEDGVVAQVPLAALGDLGHEGVEWQIPGLREELVTALLRSLPKDLRRQLVPIAEHARRFVASATPADGPLLEVLARTVSREVGSPVGVGDFDWDRVPGYLRPTLEVVGGDGGALARGKTTAELLQQLQPRFDQALAGAAQAPGLGWGPVGARSGNWDFGELPPSFRPVWQGYRLEAYPALVDEGTTVRLGLFRDEASAGASMTAGTRRLVLLNLPGARQLTGLLEGLLDNRTRLALAALGELSYGTPRRLAEDALVAAVDAAVAANGGPVRDKAGFEGLLAAVRSVVEGQARRAVASAARLVVDLGALYRRCEQVSARAATGGAPGAGLLAAGVEDVVLQLAGLAGPQMLERAGLGRVPDLQRYLTALGRRLDKLPADPGRDGAHAARAQAVERIIDKATAAARSQGRGPAVLVALEQLRWSAQELRVSLFAQSLGTRGTVSEERIIRAVKQILYN